MKLKIFSQTGKGKVRHNNEDCIMVPGFLLQDETNPLLLDLDLESWCVAVCDGIGGGKAGEIASKYLASAFQKLNNWSSDSIYNLLKLSNIEILEKFKNNSNTLGMGSTIAGIACENNQIVAFNVGDSRVYKINDGYLEQITKDDTAHQILSGIGDSDIRPSNQHSILQSIGGLTYYQDIDPHIYPIKIKSRATFIVCSDGLTDLLNIDKMEEVIKYNTSIDNIGVKLFNAALEAGGNDNISIIVLEITNN